MLTKIGLIELVNEISIELIALNTFEKKCLVTNENADNLSSDFLLSLVTEKNMSLNTASSYKADLKFFSHSWTIKT